MDNFESFDETTANKANAVHILQSIKRNESLERIHSSEAGRCIFRRFLDIFKTVMRMEVYVVMVIHLQNK